MVSMSIKVYGAADKIRIELVFSGDNGWKGRLPSLFPPKRSVSTVSLESMNRRQRFLYP